MLKVGKMTDYATVIMTIMARSPEKGFAASDIASKTHINLPTVSKILKQLTRAELLKSERGAKGGYHLAFAPNAISLTQILHIMEGNTAMTECGQSDSKCQIAPHCFIKGNWRLISQTIEDALSKISLADLVAPMNEFKVDMTTLTGDQHG